MLLINGPISPYAGATHIAITASANPTQIPHHDPPSIEGSLIIIQADEGVQQSRQPVLLQPSCFSCRRSRLPGCPQLPERG